jgi:gliding motility-associated-like protein
MGDTTTTNSLSYSWNQIGTFIIEVIETSIDGCISNPEQTSIIIERCPQSLIYIPNSFTPDGNEHNNIWLPIMTSGFDPFDYNLIVMNRWGQTIFESNNSNQGWDGTYKNRLCDQGIYIYKIKYGVLENDGSKELYGHINLIR